MATDYNEDGARIGLDGASSITWQAACEVAVIDWDKTDQVIFSAHANSTSHAPASESFRLQWRNVSDSGTFADLVTGSGELRAGISAGAIINTDPVGSSDGCGTGTPSQTEEVENESPLQTASLTATKNNSLEMQWCIDFSNALDSKEYAFQLYSVTGGEALGQCTPTITTDAGAAPIPKGYVDTLDGVDIFSKATIFQTKAFVDSGSGADAIVNPFRAMEFTDSEIGSDVFAIVFKSFGVTDSGTGVNVFTIIKFMDFVDTGAGIDIFTLTRPMEFTDVGSGSDVFGIPFKEMGISDVGGGSDSFAIVYKTIGFNDVGGGADVFGSVIFRNFTESGSGTDVFTLTRPIYFADTATGTDVFGTPFREMGITDLGFGTDVFEILFKAVGFIDTGYGVDVFEMLKLLGFSDVGQGTDIFTTLFREMGFTEVGGGIDAWTISMKSLGFADAGTGSDVFVNVPITGITQKILIDTGLGMDKFSKTSFVFEDISEVTPLVVIYVERIGLKGSEIAPAGQVAVYHHIIKRFRDTVPSFISRYSTDEGYNSQVDLSYSLEYPDKEMVLPHIALNFVSEMQEEIGVGMIAGGEDLEGVIKIMLLNLDIWARNSSERDMIADALLKIIHVSRAYFNNLGFIDVKHSNSGTRTFEQSQSTIYPRVSQQSTKIYRKVVSLEISYSLVFEKLDPEQYGTIQEIDILGDINDDISTYEVDTYVGSTSDLLLDSKFAINEMENIVQW